MKKHASFFFFLLSVWVGYGQTVVDPHTFTQETNPDNSNFEFYSRATGVNRRATFNNVRKRMTPTAQQTGVAYYPSPTGNTSNLGEVVRDPSGNTWYIDGLGQALQLNRMVAGSGITIAGDTITAADTDALNEAWTIDADDADQEVISSQIVKFQGAGNITTDYNPSTNTLLITGTTDTTTTANVYTTNGTFDDSLRIVGLLRSLWIRSATDTTGFLRLQYGLLKGSRLNMNYDSAGLYYTNGTNTSYISVRDTAARFSFADASGSATLTGYSGGLRARFSQAGDALKLENTSSSSSTSGGLLSLACYDNAAVVFGDRLGKIDFRGQTNGSGGTGIGASIQAFSLGTWSATSRPGALSIYTTDPSATTETERARFYSTTFRLRNNTYLGFDNTGNTILIYRLSPFADSSLQFTTSTGGELFFGGKIGFSGTTKTYNSNQNNVFLGAFSYFSITASGADIDFTGAVRSSVVQNCRIVFFYNNGGAGSDLHDVVFKNESASSTAANRFALPDSADIRLKPYESISFIYDNTLSRWVPFGYVGNKTSGTATLVAGTVTVNCQAVRTGSKIFVSCNTPGGTQGFLSAPAASITSGTSFVINSSSATDTSTVNWWIR